MFRQSLAVTVAALLVTVAAAGQSQRTRIVTEHYDILYEYDPEGIGDMMEAAYEAWSRFWDGKTPPKNKKLIVKMYATRAAYVAGGKTDGHPTPTPGRNMGMYWPRTRIAHAYAEDGPGAMRYEMLHECLHQFHFQAATGNRMSGDKGWYREGLATWIGNSGWDGTTYRMGGGSARGPSSFDTLKGLRGDNYDGHATFLVFLVTQYPLQFKQLRDGLDMRRKEMITWKQAFGWEKPPRGFVQEFQRWIGANYSLPSWSSWDDTIYKRALPAALNLAAYILEAEDLPSVQKVRRGLEATKYGVNYDFRVLGADLQKALRDLSRYRHPAAKACVARIITAFNELRKIDYRKKLKAKRR